jgi:hypothetical protein
MSVYKYYNNSIFKKTFSFMQLLVICFKQLKVFYCTGYADEIKKLIFSLPTTTLAATLQRYEAKVPEPLNRQFSERRNREEAINRWAVRKTLRTELCPPGTMKTSNYQWSFFIEL